LKHPKEAVLMTNTIFHGYSKKDTANPLLISTKIKMKNRGMRGERYHKRDFRDSMFAPRFSFIIDPKAGYTLMRDDMHRTSRGDDIRVLRIG